MNQMNRRRPISAAGNTAAQANLIRAWIAGDRLAFDQFFEQTYQSHFIKKADQLLRTETQIKTVLPAPDLVNRTYFKMVKHPITSFQSWPAFWSWVQTTMKKLIIDAARKHRALKRGGLNSQWIDLDTALSCLDGHGGRQS